MHAHSIVAFKKASLLLPLVLLCGCGGGGGGGTTPQKDSIQILRQDGLVFTLEPNMPATPMGDQMSFWFSVTNDGLTSTRTLELRERSDEQGGRTSLGTITYEDGAGNRSLVYALSRYDGVSMEVKPGESVCLAKFDWNQIRQDNGEAASPGYYDLAIVLDNVYVDGKKLANWPTFEVRGETRVNFMKSGPSVDPRELLRAEGLIVSLGLQKLTYQKGAQIPVWFEVTNAGSQTRTLEARIPVDVGSLSSATGIRRFGSGHTTRSNQLATYMGGFMYYTPDGHDYITAWGFGSTDPVSMQIAPGETIRLVESVWNQVNRDGTPAGAGYYDAYVSLSNLYVDGRNLGNAPNFEVDVTAPIRIVE